MSVKTITVANVGGTIQILVANVVKPNIPECFALTSIKSVIPTYNLLIGRSGIDLPTPYPFTDQLMVTVNFDNEHANPPIRFDIQTVTNQAGWTLDFAGLTQAVSDICGWITLASAGIGDATEATLIEVRDSVRDHQAFNFNKLVDTGNGNKVFFERAEFLEEFGTYIYAFVDIGGVAYAPTGPNIVYGGRTPRTPSFLRVLGIANTATAVDARSVSFFNAGPVNATVDGAVLAPGEGISFDAGGQSDILPGITYVTIATGILLITTVV